MALRAQCKTVNERHLVRRVQLESKSRYCSLVDNSWQHAKQYYAADRKYYHFYELYDAIAGYRPDTVVVIPPVGWDSVEV